jgi:WD40 repeat protein
MAITNFTLKLSGVVTYTDNSHGSFETSTSYKGKFGNGLVSTHNNPDSQHHISQLFADKPAEFQAMLDVLGGTLQLTPPATAPDKTVNKFTAEFSGNVTYSNNSTGVFSAQWSRDGAVGLFPVDTGIHWNALEIDAGTRSYLKSALDDLVGPGNVIIGRYYSWDDPSSSTLTEHAGWGNAGNQGLGWHPSEHVLLIASSAPFKSPIMVDYRSGAPIEINVPTDLNTEYFHVKFSPEGNAFAAGDWTAGTTDGVTVWLVDEDFNVSEPITPPGQTAKGQGTLAWSPDGQYLISGFFANGIKWWRREDDEFIALTSPSFTPDGTASQDLVWSPDGGFIAVAGAVGVKEGFFLYSVDYSTETLIAVDFPRGPRPAEVVYSCEWSNDGELLVLMSNNGYYYIYRRDSDDVFSHIETLTINDDYGAYAHFHPTDRYFIVYGFGAQMVYIYSIVGDAFTELSIMATPSNLTAGWGHIQFSHDAKYIGIPLVDGANSGFAIWETSGDLELL